MGERWGRMDGNGGYSVDKPVNDKCALAVAAPEAYQTNGANTACGNVAFGLAGAGGGAQMGNGPAGERSRAPAKTPPYQRRTAADGSGAPLKL